MNKIYQRDCLKFAFESIASKFYSEQPVPHFSREGRRVKVKQTLKLTVVLLLLSFFQFSLGAQVTEMNDNGGTHTISFSGVAEDYFIPVNTSYNAITFTIKGGDGGLAELGDCKSTAGNGATTTVTLRIGEGAGAVRPGDYVRFIVGEGGTSVTSSIGFTFNAGSGGGGSAVLISSDQVNWEILGVAGGGGGAYQGAIVFCVDSQKGQGGRSTTGGGDGAGRNSGDGGTNGNGGQGGGTNGTGDLSGGGGGAFSNGGGNFRKEGKAGFPNGGAGGVVPDLSRGKTGGWGFGGGGASEDAPGGGGGYSGGGGGGEVDNGGGGGSYSNPDYAVNPEIIAGGNNGGTSNGNIKYKFENICVPNITGFSYINPLCQPNDQGRIQLEYSPSGTNNCNASQFEFSLKPVNGWGDLGNGVFRALRAGTYTAYATNTTLNAVVEKFTFIIGVTNEAPTAVCQDITVDLTNGTYSNNNLARLIDGGSFGPCDPVLTASKTSFNCSNLGDNRVTLTVSGSHNLSSTCRANVRVQLASSEQAVANCKENLSFDLGGGTLTLTVDDIDNGSSVGGCATGLSISPSTFDCSNLGENAVTLTVGSGQNVATCTTIIAITDSNTPTANCKNTASVTLIDGSASIDYNLLDNGSLSNNCASLSYEISQSDFDCTHIGVNDIRLTVTDEYNNQSTCTTTVSVIDNTNPVAICQDIEVALDENGSYTLDPAELDGGSTDACALRFSASQTLFDCEDLGDNDITLTATDPQGNESSCTAQVTVIDDIAPVAGCSDLTIQLIGGTGSYSVFRTQFFIASSDNCRVTSSNFIGSTSVSCEDVGIQEREFEVIDASGNRSVCTFSVTVLDERGPYAECQDITVQLDDTGRGSITPAQIDNGSFDDCTAISLALDKSQFDCDDIGTNNTVTLTATDDYGNTSSCDATITIVDQIAPTANCQQSIIIDLTADETATLTADMIASASTDNCGTINLSIESGQQQFDCSHLGELFLVRIKVEDATGNASRCAAVVTVADPNSYCNAAPVAVCQDIMVDIGDNCQASITATQLDGGSSDPNGDPLTFSLDNEGPFAVGVHPLTLTVSDGFLSSSCTANLTVEDNTVPIAICQDVTVELDESGKASVTPEQIAGTSTDNCGPLSFFINDGQTTFDCSMVGRTYSLRLEIEDEANNFARCNASVTVTDPNSYCNQPPVALCQDITVEVGDDCQATITANDIDGGSSDPNGDSMSFSADPAGPFDLGVHAVVLTISDGTLSSSCEALVTVEDQTAPEVTAALNFQRCIDDDEGSQYVVDCMAADNCAAGLTTRAFISLTPMNNPRVIFRKRSKKKLQFLLKQNRITVSAPGNGGAQDWWSQILVDGGILVQQGQQIDVVGDDDDDSNSIIYQFNSSGALRKVINSSLLTLTCVAVDPSGNQSTDQITVGQLCNDDDDDDSDDDDYGDDLIQSTTDESTGEEQRMLNQGNIGIAAWSDHVQKSRGSLQAFPNPFTEQLTISVSLPESGPLNLQVFNMQGQLVRTLEQGQLQAGAHTYKWDGRNANRQTLSGGMYLIKMETGGQVKIRKVVLAR